MRRLLMPSILFTKKNKQLRLKPICLFLIEELRAIGAALFLF